MLFSLKQVAHCLKKQPAKPPDGRGGDSRGRQARHVHLTPWRAPSAARRKARRRRERASEGEAEEEAEEAARERPERKGNLSIKRTYDGPDVDIR